MSVKFAVFEVSAEFLMDVAKEVASSPHPLNKSILLDSFDKVQSYTIRFSLIHRAPSLNASSLVFSMKETANMCQPTSMET
jgi:hypothetical protein